MKFPRTGLLVAVTVLASMAAPLQAQDTAKFPQPVDRQELESIARFRALLQQMSDAPDSFWIFSQAQFDSVLVTARQKQLGDSIIVALKNKVELQTSIAALQDSTRADLRRGFDRFYKKWEETDRRLEEEEVKVLKLRRSRFVMGVLGLGAGALIAILAR